MGAVISEIGDDWDESYPHVISGHIHNSQLIGNNIHYTGSSMQHAFGETDDKGVWLLSFDKDQGLDEEFIKIPMKTRKILNMDMDEILDFNEELLEKYILRINLECSYEEFVLFRKSKDYKRLEELGVKVCPQYTRDTSVLHNMQFEKMNYEYIYRNLIDKEDKIIQDTFNEIMTQ